MSQSVFRGSDIRGKYPEEINEEFFKQLGEFFAGFFADGEIVICHDGRTSSPSLAKSLCDGLKESALKNGKNFKIEFAGLGTTPMFYFLCKKYSVSGGIMVTASHNPKDENGLIVMGGEGKLISGEKIGNLFKT